MSTGKSVFIVGPGFIGWNVLDLLIAEGYSVTGLVRRDSHAKQIHRSGAKVIIGNLNDYDLIASEAAKHDITIHTATADHLSSAKAILDGVEKRAQDGKMSIYIHTSGTSVLDDKSKGDFKTDKIFYDDRPEDIDALDDDAPHRPIDLEIVRTARRLGEKAKIIIMTPPEIYGFNPRHKRLTIQIPVIARFAVKNDFAPMVGKGLGVESQIHVLDLARGYIKLLHWMESAPASEVNKNPYVFCENGKEFSWLEVAENVGRTLHARGLLKDPTPKQIGEEHYDDLFGSWTPAVVGLNSRSRAIRLREMGWEPREKGIWESWEEDELPELLKEEG
jgi:nucleoside-diphosphate-sugar epimerase